MVKQARIRSSEQVMGYYPLVRRIAASIHLRLPRSVELDDLVNVGVLALIESQQRYDPSRGVPFDMFARHRIRGGILDALRGEDWVPHSVRRKAQLIDETRRQLSSRLGRRPSEQELADQLGFELEECQTLSRQAVIRRMLSLDAPVGHDNPAPLIEQVPSDFDVEDEVSGDELRDLVRSAIGELPEREATAITLHYLQDIPLRAVGDHLGVTESRACQLCGQGIKRLRKRIGRLAA